MTVRRNHLLADSFSQIMALEPEQLSRRLRIRFKDEPGIDAGGLLREWCLLVAQDLFDPQFGLFVAHGEDSAYSINPVSGLCNELHLDYFRFAGRFIGKALLEHQTLPAHFSLPIVKHMLRFVVGELPASLPTTSNTFNLLRLSLTPALSSVLYRSPQPVELYQKPQRRRHPHHHPQHPDYVL